MPEFSNGLSKAEEERLECLAEEAGEIVQACMKILRHGYESRHPDGGPTNRESLAREVGNFQFIKSEMIWSRDLPQYALKEGIASKKENWKRFTHHQHKE